MKLRKSMIGQISLFIGLVIYYFLAIIAIFNYSGGFDIFNDLWTHLRWFAYNPNGAVFFRMGNLIYALTLSIFFLSINRSAEDETLRNTPLIFVQIIGFSIALSMLISEIFADQNIVFFIASGLVLLLTIIILIGFTSFFYRNSNFWKTSILLFIVTILLSSYLVYMGITNTPIQEFRIIDLLVNILNQASIFAVALNITKIQDS